MRLFAAADEHMSDREITQHLFEEKIEVAARAHTGEIGLEALFRRDEIETVIVRVVKEVALDAPDLVIHLLPIGARIDENFHSTRIERARAGLRRFRRRHDEPVPILRVERLFAVGRKNERGDAGRKRRDLARGHVELRDGEPRRAGIVLRKRRCR